MAKNWVFTAVVLAVGVASAQEEITEEALLRALSPEHPALVALALFGEHLGRREAAGAALVFLGAAVLSYGPGSIRAEPWGVLAIAAVCACWAVDNNLTQRLSLEDPVSVVHEGVTHPGAEPIARVTSLRP